MQNKRFFQKYQLRNELNKCWINKKLHIFAVDHKCDSFSPLSGSKITCISVFFLKKRATVSSSEKRRKVKIINVKWICFVFLPAVFYYVRIRKEKWRKNESKKKKKSHHAGKYFDIQLKLIPCWHCVNHSHESE